MVYLGRDVITIASALMTNGCDVIASLPQGSHSPDTRYSILNTHAFIPCIRILHRETSSISARGAEVPARKAARAWSWPLPQAGPPSQAGSAEAPGRFVERSERQLSMTAE